MSPVQFDISAFDALFDERVAKVIREFEAEYPETCASAMGFAYYGPTPTLIMGFDTEVNCQKYSDLCPEGVFEDEQGAYYVNPHDFAFTYEFGFDGFPNIYDSPKPWQLIFPDGSSKILDETTDDNDFSEAIAGYLEARVAAVCDFNGLKRASTFRVILYCGYGDSIRSWLRN
ncbi:MAG: hypothetical protein R3C18_15365 [Planctomycetaceae bacterium]